MTTGSFPAFFPGSQRETKPLNDENTNRLGGNECPALFLASARATALRQVRSSSRTQSARGGFEVVKNSESVGYSMVEGKVTPVYRVIIQNTAIPGSRPQEIILPLVQADKTKIE